MQISIVLMTHNHLEIIRLCLEHIQKYADEPYELIVVDNGSTDEITEYLQVQEDIKLISNSENLGIAKGYNQGTELANGKYILFMNCYSLLTENCLSSMLHCLQSDEIAAMVGPVSNDVSGHQRISIPYQDLKELDDFAQKNRTQNIAVCRRVFRLLSHCLLVKKEVLEELGGFDERYGLGTFEDDDLCLSAINNGYTLHIALDAFVHYMNPLTLPGYDTSGYLKLLAENRQKAIAKWGFDIADYLLKKTVPISISLCMIVKNEGAVLARCLNCVKDIADEIIIVDTGSTDETKNIAKVYTNKIYDFTWIDDFAAARNFAFAQATKQYILWLDADDVILTKDRERFLILKNTLDPSVDSITMHYHLGHDNYENVTVSMRRNRLVKRANHFQWIGAVHEYLAVSGKIIDGDVAITHQSEGHDTDRNLKIYENRLAAGELFSPRDQYYYANELMDHKKYEKAIEWYMKFLETKQGWVEDNLSACKKLTDCYQQLGNFDNAVKCIFQSFLFDIPRAEFCCRLGYHFQTTGQYKPAAFWYKLATELPKPADNCGFIDHACWTWLPHLQLCVCYDRLGEYELANQHNEFAAQYMPEDTNILSNREYLKGKLQT